MTPLSAAQAASLTRIPVDPRAAISYQRTREMTIDELLLENRIVFLVGEINQASAARVMMQMLYLENQKRGADINFYINSPGGAVDDTLAICETVVTLIRSSESLRYTRAISISNAQASSPLIETSF